MKRSDIETGKTYAIVRQGRDREGVIHNYRKVRVVDMENRYYFQPGRFGTADRIFTYKPEDGGFSRNHGILVEVLERTGYGWKSEVEVLDPPEQWVVEPRAFYLPWDDFVAQRERRRKEQEERRQAREEQIARDQARWDSVIEKLAPLLNENMKEVLQAARRSTVSAWGSERVTFRLADLEHLADTFEELR